MDQTADIEARIIAHLLAAGCVSQAQVSRAAQARQASGGRTDLALTRLGLAAEREMAAAYGEVLGLPLAAAAEYPAASVLPDKLPASFLRGARMLPLRIEAGALVVALADPLDAPALEALRLAAGQKLILKVALAGELEAALERLYGPLAAAPEDRAAPNTPKATADMRHLREQASDAAAVQLLNRLIGAAVAAGASDIHIEPFEARLSVRLRIDGALEHAAAPDFTHHAAIIGRIKVLAQLDMAERRKPQDGRALISIGGRRIDLRVSILPSLHGEAAVLRILDRERAPLDLDGLGFGPDLRAQIARLVAQPHGMLLVCGPTGSGKTTTQYAILRTLHNAQTKIVTVEDPVEYQIDGVSQIQVRPQIGLGFADVLRSVLRHDPDVIMVGEARDSETARITVQAALTGHMVLCSLHTNDAAGAVARLIDMGVEPYLLASTLRGVLAQRLVRKLCTLCRQPDHLAMQAAHSLGLPPGAAPQRPAGCAACRNSGFSGRTAIAEFLPASAQLQELILRKADSGEIHRAAMAGGMRPLRAAGLAIVAGGVTSLDEVLRVTEA